MPNINPIKPGQFPRADEWNALAQDYNAGAIGAKGYPGRRLPASSGLVWIKNASASDRSRWDVMKLGDTTETIDDAGNVSVAFSATAATADGTPVILQEPIATGLYGIGRIFGVTLAKIKQATAATDRFGTPAPATHNIEASPSGPIQILSAPSTTAASVRPVLLGGGGVAVPLQLRISGFDYQLSRDGGTTWETWGTGGQCP